MEHPLPHVPAVLRDTLVIRHGQMATLRIFSDPAFVPRLIGHLRTHYPEETASRDDVALTEWIRDAVTEAAHYDIEASRELFRFAGLAMRYGLGWSTTPDRRWMHDCLADRAGGTARQRMDRLVRRCLYRLETEAALAKPIAKPIA
jgi:hypothetical protein